MMGTKLIVQCICLFAFACGCSNESNSCGLATLGEEDIIMYIQPYSATEIIDMEKERGLLKSIDMKERRAVLTSQFHFRIKILSKRGFSEDQENFLHRLLPENLVLYADAQSLPRSLFIDESSFAHNNIVQYLVAFENTAENKLALLNLKIDGRALGLNKEIVSFYQYCFE